MKLHSEPESSIDSHCNFEFLLSLFFSGINVLNKKNEFGNLLFIIELYVGKLY